MSSPSPSPPEQNKTRSFNAPPTPQHPLCTHLRERRDDETHLGGSKIAKQRNFRAGERECNFRENEPSSGRTLTQFFHRSHSFRNAISLSLALFVDHFSSESEVRGLLFAPSLCARSPPLSRQGRREREKGGSVVPHEPKACCGALVWSFEPVQGGTC